MTTPKWATAKISQIAARVAVGEITKIANGVSFPAHDVSILGDDVREYRLVYNRAEKRVECWSGESLRNYWGQ